MFSACDSNISPDSVPADASLAAQKKFRRLALGALDRPRTPLNGTGAITQDMSKRAVEADDYKPPKRQKPDQQPRQPPKAPEEIHFARQLQTALAFRQDGIQELRNGIASFKALLESVLYHKNEDDRGRELSILREYLESQRPTNPTDTERPFLAQLWQAWSFANTSNNDHLCSSASAVFALLLKTLSSLLDFRDIGIQLCRTVLQGQHLRLIKRNLDAPRHKDFLISPCLRVLIEVTSFDGGVLAREVYKRREQTFDAVTLRRCLGYTRPDLSDEEAKRRPAIRTLTLRYVLCHLKYLHEGGKADLLKSRPLCTSLFHFLRDDPADVAIELLSAVEQHVLKDGNLPRSAKAGILLQHNLERVTEIATRAGAQRGAADRAFAWLKAVCSQSSYGIVRESGWYPPGTDKIPAERRYGRMIDLGLDSIDFFDRDDRPIVRSANLLSFIQTLRPHSSLEERELVITCFKSAPELVAAYFAEKHLQLEPKLSNTWIGYASFVFEVLQLPVPKFFGHDDGWAQLPPQINIMLESILPRPLTQKVLTRCLNQNSGLITFFAIRILVLGLEKLLETTQLLAEGEKFAGSRSGLWHEASSRLRTAVIERCPNVKDVITTFRKLEDDDDHALQRTSITRLLWLYYETSPLEATDPQFDVSVALGAELSKSDSDENEKELIQLQAMRRSHLVQIAARSPGMRWLGRQGSFEVSPITRLLKLHARAPQDPKTRVLIQDTLVNNNVISSSFDCDSLVATLRTGSNKIDVVATFLDDCFARANRQAVKYRDMLEALGDVHSRDDLACPNLMGVFLEQIPFVVKRPDNDREELVPFVKKYLEIRIAANKIEMSGDSDLHEILLKMQQNILDAGQVDDSPILSDPRNTFESVLISPTREDPPREVETELSHAVKLPFSLPPVESEDHPELFKWSKKDLGIALDDGDVSSLILCLSSQYPEIRSQALGQLQRLEEKIINSNVDDKDPIYILVGELIETYKHHCLSGHEAFPYLASCFATKALEVQMHPTHFIYPKINKYLNRGPDWRVNKLPSYWVQNSVLSQPEDDDAYWKEVQWVLEWLVDGLRSATDVEVLRKGKVFEKIMSLHSSPGAGTQLKERILELLYRATFVEGGSSTLVTRTGVLGWLDMVAREKSDGVLAFALKERIKETSDREKVEGWCGTTVETL